MATETSTKLTYDDYVNLPNDGKRYEIIDGELYLSPSPNKKHQLVSRNIFLALCNYFALPRKLGEVFYAPFDVVMSHVDVVQPDILYISAQHMAILTAANVKGAPDLVIEVLSGSTRDYDETTKLKRYERFGVNEYWIADPETDQVRIHRHDGKRFERIDVADSITTPLLPGFSLPLAEVIAE